jgi:hypothetical protein
MTKEVKGLDARSRFQGFFISVSPLLETLNIFVLSGLAPEEVFFVILLHAEMRKQ